LYDVDGTETEMGLPYDRITLMIIIETEVPQRSADGRKGLNDL